MAKAVTIEKTIENTLVSNGLNPERVNQKLPAIRGILFYHPKQNLLLSEKTLDRYIHEIVEDGTIHSTPYRNILKAVNKYDLIL